MHLHCTKKLIKQLGLSTDALETSLPSNQLLAWHAHITFIARGKTLVAVNDQTFYAIIMSRLRKKNFGHFANEFCSTLYESLRSEGFQESLLNSLFSERISYAKTHNRQVLGITKEAINHIRYYVESRGGWDRTDVVELTKQINRTPWLAGTRHCVFPIEKMTFDLRVP